jgi:prepilin-type N-terminal cleavage/methylation domain-containing protein
MRDFFWGTGLSLSESGFTIVELTMVIVIIGVLATVAVPRFIGLADESKAAVCRENLSVIKSVSTLYAMDPVNPRIGHYPDAIADLVPRYLEAVPECPIAGVYDYDSGSGLASCGEDGHEI